VGTKFDGFVKSRKIPFSVIFRYIGESSFFNWLQSFWTPVFTGVTAFYESIKFNWILYFGSAGGPLLVVSCAYISDSWLKYKGM